jgi:hypothetical protein
MIPYRGSGCAELILSNPSKAYFLFVDQYFVELTGYTVPNIYSLKDVEEQASVSTCGHF